LVSSEGPPNSVASYDTRGDVEDLDKTSSVYTSRIEGHSKMFVLLIQKFLNELYLIRLEKQVN
jgi:hypothetical protein